MRTIRFLFLDKQELDVFLPDLFQILHSNMSVIAPTGNSYKEDYAIWTSHIIPAIQEEQRKIVLMYVEDTLAGYFQYHIDLEASSLMLEEIQIIEPFQKVGLFSQFLKWLVKQLPQNILYIEAYADKRNCNSQAVLNHLGLVQLGENKNGISFYYKGKYAELLNKYME